MALTRTSLLQTLLAAATSVPLVAGCGGKTTDPVFTTGEGGAGGSSGTSGQGGTSTTGGASGGSSVGGAGPAGAAGATAGAGGSVIIGTGGAAGDNATGGAGGGKIACESPTPVLAGGQETGLVRCANGALVRVEAKVCPNLLSPTQTCSIDGAGGCHSNADCKGGSPYGYCQGVPGANFCECASGCVQDSDCASDELCECGSTIGRCVKATCHTSADCPEGGCAQVEVGYPGCGTQAFACQTKADQCASNQDCQDGGSLCHTEAPGEPRQCVPQSCAVGRPLVVEQAWRLATLTAGAGWA